MRKSPVYAIALTAMAVLALTLSGCGDKKEPLTPGAKILTQQQLETTVAALGYPVYWLGPRDGVEYEYTHRNDGRVYVRYVKPGTPAGSHSLFLTVGTYPMADAYDVVKKISQLPDATKIPVKGGVGAQSSKKPDSVYVAFRGKDLEIEVYAPGANAAVQEVESGDLEPISTK
jgi:hypothetical protein